MVADAAPADNSGSRAALLAKIAVSVSVLAFPLSRTPIESALVLSLLGSALILTCSLSGALAYAMRR